MSFSSFAEKWRNIKKEDKTSDEKRLFVEKGQEPLTQRQLNLYYYFLFIKKIVEDIGAKDILEIGCGRGTMSLYLNKYLGLNTDLLDNDEAAVAVARKHFIEYGGTGNFFLVDALHTDLPANHYDAIVSIGLAEHIENVEQLFREQYRLLKPDGVMISLNIPKKFSIQFFNKVFLFFKNKLWKFSALPVADYYRNSLKPKDYLKIAEKVGFKNVYIVNVCPFPLFTSLNIEIDKKITKIYKVILKIRKLFQPFPYKTGYFLSQGHFLVGYKNNNL